MSEKIRPPLDAVGNELHEGDLVALVTGKQLVGKVVAVQSGGLHTNQGITPSRVRIVLDINFGCMPGMTMGEVVKIVNPGQQQALESLLKQ